MLSKREIDERLHAAFMEARKGKRMTVDEYKFEMNFAENIIQLREDIVNYKYKPSRSTAFICHEPVDREIFAAPFRDRVVHHFICEYIMEWWDKRLIDAAYSCRKGKGTDSGIRDMYRKMRKISKNFQEETMMIKIDLSSYFCSIPRKKLYERVKWGLKKQFLESEGATKKDAEIYKMLEFLCRQVIFDDPVEGVRLKGSKYDWARYPRRKSLFYQEPGIGIVIGNLTSQMFSNIFLDALDRFIMLELGIKGYGRYVDDAFFVIPEKDYRDFLENKLPIIYDFIAGMGLKVNQKKTFCQNVRKGVPFLGVVLYPYHVAPGRRLVRNFKKTVELVQAGEKDLDCLVSFLGRLSHMDAEKLVKRVFEQYGMDYLPASSRAQGSIYYTDPKAYERYKYWKKG